MPAIVQGVLENNPHYPPEDLARLAGLRDALRSDAPLPPIERAHFSPSWAVELQRRTQDSWLSTDWFFAETYAYRKIVELCGWFETGRDPFEAQKREEYAGRPFREAFERALQAEAPEEQRLSELFAAALFGNRIDLSYAASLQRGTQALESDLLADDRAEAAECLRKGSGSVHVIADNAGTELAVDLVLIDFLIREYAAQVTLHLKVHPTFVSDATQGDVERFLGLADGEASTLPWGSEIPGARSLVQRLVDAIGQGRLQLAPHWFWNGPGSLWEAPAPLEAAFAHARLVVLKGDANYRRAMGDALWPPHTPFAQVTAYFPAPLFALRTLKSEPLVGLDLGQAESLDQTDSTWRVNGRRAVAQLGGALTSGR